MAPLGLLSRGEKAEVVEIRMLKAVSASDSKDGARGGEACRIEDMGIRVGKTVEMLSNEGRGPMLIRVDESRIAMGRGMAMKIMVRRNG